MCIRDRIKASNGRLMAFFLNDAEADGRDVSWIWDVDFECLAETPGIRALDVYKRQSWRARP